MIDFSNHTDVVNGLRQAQDAEKDQREHSRECDLFLNKRDGQWEPEIAHRFSQNGRPRYTFDLCNPVINTLSGAIRMANFGIKVRPANGEADEDKADLLAGMIRNIESISNAQNIYNNAATSMVGTGFDAWMVTQEYSDSESFDQDLYVRPINSAIDTVYWDPNSMRQDRSDARWATKLTAMSKNAYKERFPEGSGQSVAEDRTRSGYYDKADQVVVGEFYWIEEKPVTLIQMSDGSVYKESELERYSDQLAMRGITEQRRRKRFERVVKIRHYDGADWLSDEKETVFNWIPLIPLYGYFRISENKITFRGETEKLLDQQRVHNYAHSAEVLQTALSPIDKVWITPEQAVDHEDQLERMNQSSDSVQYYNHVEDQPNPYRMGTAQTNPNLAVIANSTRQAIFQSSGVFAASMGDNPSLQSGVAIEQLQERGDVSMVHYFDSMEVALTHTARILVDAIPKVYDATRQVRILGEDGVPDQIDLNKTVIDENGQPKIVNDLSTGRYDVTMDIGKSFKSRQQESIAAILEMASIDPTVVEMGSDILLNNANGPSLDLIAQRKRLQLMNSGLIPEDQWTDEERQAMEEAQALAAQQPQQPSMEEIGLQIQQMDAQAKLLSAQNDQQKLMIDSQLKQQDQEIKAVQGQQKFELEIAKMQQSMALAMEENQRANQKLAMDMAQAVEVMQKTNAETMKLIRESMGADAIVSPTAAVAYEESAENLAESESAQ